MISGRSWTWGHIPKTGGDASYEIVGMMNVDVAMSERHDVSKHKPFGDHIDITTQDRERLINIRRLPNWVLSVITHKKNFGWFDTGPIGTTVEQAIEERWPDACIEHITQNGRYSIDHVLRMENLSRDWHRFLTNKYGEGLKLIEPSPRVNAMDYNHDVDRLWSKATIDKLYEVSPLWSDLERRADTRE